MITNGDEHNSAGYAYTTSCLVKGKIKFIISDGSGCTRNFGIIDDFSKWSSYKNPFFG